MERMAFRIGRCPDGKGLLLVRSVESFVIISLLRCVSTRKADFFRSLENHADSRQPLLLETPVETLGIDPAAPAVDFDAEHPVFPLFSLRGRQVRVCRNRQGRFAE